MPILVPAALRIAPVDVELPVDYSDEEVDISTWDTVRDEVRRSPPRPPRQYHFSSSVPFFLWILCVLNNPDCAARAEEKNATSW